MAGSIGRILIALVVILTVTAFCDRERRNRRKRDAQRSERAMEHEIRAQALAILRQKLGQADVTLASGTVTYHERSGVETWIRGGFDAPDPTTGEPARRWFKMSVRPRTQTRGNPPWETVEFEVRDQRYAPLRDRLR